MNIRLKHVQEVETTAAKFPRYIRKARGFAHLASICTGERQGFDLGVAFFRNGETAAIMWADLDFETVKKIHAVDKYAQFVYRGEVYHHGQHVPAFNQIITCGRASKLALMAKEFSKVGMK